MRQVFWFIGLMIYTALMAALAAGVTILFIEGLDVIRNTLFPDGMDGEYSWQRIMLVTLAGGLLVGIINKTLGDYPKSMLSSINEFKKTKQFDYKHLPQTFAASYASLGFGASLGPEAALITIVGGVGSWINDRVSRFLGKVDELKGVAKTALGLAGGSPPRGTSLRTRTWALAAGGVALVIFILIVKEYSSGGYFNYDLPDFELTTGSFVMVVLVSLLATGVGLLFIGLHNWLGRLFAPYREHKVLFATLGGLALGLLGLVSVLFLFSGHEGVQELASNPAEYGFWPLAGLAIGKIFIADLLLMAGWKGGRFFPLIFAGAAAGMALFVALDSEVSITVAIVAGASAILGFVMTKLIFAIAFCILLFPYSTAVLVVVAAVIGNTLFKLARQRYNVELPD